MIVNKEECHVIREKIEEVQKEIKEKEKELMLLENELKNFLPSGYWWAYTIDSNWRRPKKYKIKEIKDGRITVKEVYKKAPWKGFTGESWFSIKGFLELEIFKTEEEAKRAVYNRPCPKCGGVMKYATSEWCEDCMKKRIEDAIEYREKHRYYDPEEDDVYTLELSDELDRSDYYKGNHGRKFVLLLLDTGETIETDNLWASSPDSEEDRKLPKVKIIEGTRIF